MTRPSETSYLTSITYAPRPVFIVWLTIISLLLLFCIVAAAGCLAVTGTFALLAIPLMCALSIPVASDLTGGTSDKRLVRENHELKNRNKELAALLDVGERVSAQTGLHNRLEVLARRAANVASGTDCAILLLDRRQGSLIPVATSAGWKAAFRGLVLPLDPASLTTSTLMDMRPANIPEPSAEEQLDYRLRNAASGSSLVIVPVEVGGEPFGLMLIARTKRPKGFTRREMPLLQTLARLAAVVIQDTHLFEQVERAKQEWQASFDSIREPILVVASDGTVARANLAAARFFARDIRELQKFRCHELVWNRGTSCDECPFLGAERSAEAGQAEELAGRLGEEDFVEHGHPIVGADGRLKGYTLHLSIVTETKRLQEQMARANRLAAIGELAAGVAHNFGNVLMGVSATLDVLALKLPGVPGGETLAPIVAGAQVQVSRGGDIIHRMLSLARGTPLVTGPVPIDEVVKDVLALANTHPAARSVTFSVDLPADLPPLLVAASELEEALLNLVINAVQSCDESGKVTVAARRSRRDGCVEISVVDNGCGIPEEDLSRIFDPLVSLRCDGTLGTGLGLSTSLGLVTGMGGTIDVESRPAYGSTFTVVLPAARLEARAA